MLCFSCSLFTIHSPPHFARVCFTNQGLVGSLTIGHTFVSVVRSALVEVSMARARHAEIILARKREPLVARPIITLTTDYGTNDHLVGTLKGVILKINADVTIVDISHDVTPYDLLDGALTIGSSYSYFPPRTIHVVVVDPGVGTERRPLLVTGDTQYFVAPDNGVLSLVYEREENILVRHANVEHYYLQPVSKTFHGRDVFAPVARMARERLASVGHGRRNYRLQEICDAQTESGRRSDAKAWCCAWTASEISSPIFVRKICPPSRSKLEPYNSRLAVIP